MKGNLAHKTQGDIIDAHATAILRTLEGEDPNACVSFILTMVHKKGSDEYSMNLFQYDDSDFPDVVAAGLMKHTCDHDTEEYAGDGE